MDDANDLIKTSKHDINSEDMKLVSPNALEDKLGITLEELTAIKTEKVKLATKTKHQMRRKSV